jgi:DNA modification methylase
MSLYYQDDFVTLYHGDCLADHGEWMAADVLVTDPPYGVSYVSNRAIGRRGTAIAGDATTAARDLVLAHWGSDPALCFGRWDIPRPETTKSRLVWDKNLMGTGDLSSPWGSSDEEIYVLGDWPPVKPGGRAREGGTPSRHSSVIRAQALAPGSSDRPDHPTPKPVGLMELLIAKCPSGVIADPFAGSGATLVAAKNLGRRVIGVELEERYCEIIAKRCAQDVLDIFGGVA